MQEKYAKPLSSFPDTVSKWLHTLRSKSTLTLSFPQTECCSCHELFIVWRRLNSKLALILQWKLATLLKNTNSEVKVSHCDSRSSISGVSYAASVWEEEAFLSCHRYCARKIPAQILQQKIQTHWRTQWVRETASVWKRIYMPGFLL